jgi:eukaryotic-like serine/threonine-protein kinase
MQLSPRARETRIEDQETAQLGGQAPVPEERWYSGLVRLFSGKPVSQQTAEPSAANPNALLAFPSEGISRHEPSPIADAARRATQKTRTPATLATVASPRLVRAALIISAVAVVAAIGAVALQRFPLLQMTPREPRPGNLTINTRPIDAEVLIDGARRGTTPLTLSLTPGTHTITVRSAGDERIVPLTIASGAEVSHYFEMKPAEPVVVVGRVSVVTDPPGARVSVDGKARGTSPITVTDLTPADHKVTVTSDTGSAERTITVTAGGTASVMFSLPKVSGPVGGWLAIAAPFDVELLERDDVIGSGGTSKIMLAAGRHDITLLNTILGYQEARKIDVTAGKTMSIKVEPPKVNVSVNARPWADVSLDGASLGQTPISNLLVAVGVHEMVFRHPQLGERRQSVTVTVKGPNRIAADLTK